MLSRLQLLNDLSAIRQTCKKLKRLTDKHIQRHPELIPKSITISEQKCLVKIWHRKKNPNYVRQLLMANPIDIDATFNTSDELMRFIQGNYCGKNVEALRFDGSHVDESFGEGIKRVLDNVKIVKFVGRNSGFDNILTKC